MGSATKTYQIELTSIGSTVGEFKEGKINIGCDRGYLVGLRVYCSDTDGGLVQEYEVAVWKVNRAHLWDPEDAECILWADEISLTDDDLMYGWSGRLYFEVGSGLSNQLLVAVARTAGTALNDDYLIELDVEVDP